jgi:hypothetical protein
MNVFLAVLSVALGKSDGRQAPDADPAPRGVVVERIERNAATVGPMISYEIRYLTMGGLEWRGQFDPRLRPIERQGGAVVWAVDSVTLRQLLEHCQSDARCNVLQAPKVVAPSGDEVRVINEEAIHYVAHLDRVADGPPNEATRIAFKPEVDQVHNGVRTFLSSGQLEEEGLRTQIAISRDRVQGFHTASYTEQLRPADRDNQASKGLLASGVKRLVQGGPTSLAGTIQIPVVDSSRVDGEWVIPKDGALIVGVGVSPKTMRGRQALTDDLVVISYHLAEGVPPTPAVPAKDTAARPSPLRGPAAN